MYQNDLRFFLYIVPMHGNLITIESGRLIAVSIPLSPLPGEINRKRTTSIVNWEAATGEDVSQQTTSVQKFNDPRQLWSPFLIVTPRTLPLCTLPQFSPPTHPPPRPTTQSIGKTSPSGNNMERTYWVIIIGRTDVHQYIWIYSYFCKFADLD